MDRPNTNTHVNLEIDARTGPATAVTLPPETPENDQAPDERDGQLSVDEIVGLLEERGLLGIVDTVCQSRSLSRDEVCGRGRTRHLAIARQEVWWHIRQHSNGYSYFEIGRFFGRHHSTIVHGIRSYQRILRRQALLKRPPPFSQLPPMPLSTRNPSAPRG